MVKEITTIKDIKTVSELIKNSKNQYSDYRPYDFNKEMYKIKSHKLVWEKNVFNRVFDVEIVHLGSKDYESYDVIISFENKVIGKVYCRKQYEIISFFDVYYYLYDMFNQFRTV